MTWLRVLVGLFIAVHVTAIGTGCEPSEKTSQRETGRQDVSTGTVGPGASADEVEPGVSADKAQSDVSTATTTGDTTMNLTIESAAFKNNEQVPTEFTGDGRDVSPELSWSGVPDGTAELALIMDDPDAPTPEPWVHWVIYKIPADTKTLPKNVANTETLTSPAGAAQGKNSWGKIGYGGPAPPRGHGTHHYYFKLYALDQPLSVAPGLTKSQLLSAMEGHILGQAELVGTYQR